MLTTIARAFRRRPIITIVSAGGVILGLTTFGIVSASASSPQDLVQGAAVPAEAATQLSATARTFAALNGDASPSSVEAVVARHSTALTVVTPADLLPGLGDTVYVVVLTGNFVGYAAKLGGSATVPTGTTLSMTIDPTTYKIDDWSLNSLDLQSAMSALGTVTPLPSS